MNHIFLIPLIFFLFISFPAKSHADDLHDLRDTVMRQQKEIETLSQKVKNIEDDSASRFGWNLGLFGDVNYSTKSREHAQEAFFINELAIYSTASYGERLNFFTEIAFAQEEMEVDIERAWAGYTVNDLLILRAGKFHTALGYWNKTYHHGKQFFHTVDRPFFLAFEHDGGVMPMHITGLEVEGGKTFPVGRLKYEFQLGNGPALKEDMRVLDPNDTSDNNSSKQPVIRISFKPSAISGLSAGLSATAYEVNTSTRKGVDEAVYGVDIYYSGKGLEFISEGFLFRNSDGSGNACYVQLAYAKDTWTPYARFERLEVEKGDPYFADIENGFDRSQTILGVRYDMDPVISSLKFQYRRDDSDRDYDVFETQWSFHF